MPSCNHRALLLSGRGRQDRVKTEATSKMRPSLLALKVEGAHESRNSGSSEAREGKEPSNTF